MTDIERVCKFLDDAGTYYLATVEGDQPRVRPFGTALIWEGKLYIQTGKIKNVSKQLAANPKAEICAFRDGQWIRIAGELVNDDRREPGRRQHPGTVFQRRHRDFRVLHGRAGNRHILTGACKKPFRMIGTVFSFWRFCQMRTSASAAFPAT